MSVNRPKLVYVVTVPMTLRYKLAEQIGFMSQSGYEVHVVVGEGSDVQRIPLPACVHVHTISLHREISAWNDLKSIWQVFWLLRAIKPQIVSASTPKAGLIGMLAAWLNRVPVRVHTLRGLRHETLSGVKAAVLKIMERVTALCATRVLSVSESLRQVYIDAGLCRPSKVSVLGDGSSNGVDANRFDAGRDRQDFNRALRTELDIPQDAPVIGFLGRFTKDKGFEELSQAFDFVLQQAPETRLLLVGKFEDGDPVPADCQQRLKANPHVIFVPFVTDAARYYSVIDVLAFPSYREGLPVVPLEAAAAGIPSVTFASTGCVDVIRNGETGTIVASRDAGRFGKALLQYVVNDELRNRHGRAAQKWVREAFQPEKVWQSIADEYKLLLLAAGLTPPTEKGLEESVGTSQTLQKSVQAVSESEQSIMTKPQLVVIGSGGHAKVVIQTARAAGYDVPAIYDDDPDSWNTQFMGAHVIGPTSDIPESCDAVIAVGSNDVRHKLAASLPCRWKSVIHPTAVIDPTAEIGEGSMVLAGCVVQADAKLGRHVIMNTASSVDHDSTVGDFCHLCPGVRLAGDAHIGDGVMMGINASIIPRVFIGDWCTIGAGAAVIRDIPSHSTAVGVPATVLPDRYPSSEDAGAPRDAARFEAKPK